MLPIAAVTAVLECPSNASIANADQNNAAWPQFACTHDKRYKKPARPLLSKSPDWMARGRSIFDRRIADRGLKSFGYEEQSSASHFSLEIPVRVSVLSSKSIIEVQKNKQQYKVKRRNVFFGQCYSNLQSAKSWLAVSALRWWFLVTIVMTIVLIRALGQASRGFINPQDVMLFMAYSALGRLTDHPDPVAIHRHSQRPVTYVPRQRDGRVVHQRPGPHWHS